MFFKTPLWKGDDDSMIIYPDGTLLKASGPEIDRMEAGRRRWIPDPPTFNCMGLNWNAVQTISDSEWNLTPKGTPYPSRADGTLLQGSGPQVYVMTSCQRHWIPDPDTFNALGYNWNAIQHIADADLTAIPEGAPLPSKVQQPTTTDNASPKLAQQQDQLSQQITAVTQQIQQIQAKQPMSQEDMLKLQQLMSQQQQLTEIASNLTSEMKQAQQTIVSKM